jgi:hypothetical protein
MNHTARIVSKLIKVNKVKSLSAGIGSRLLPDSHFKVTAERIFPCHNVVNTFASRLLIFLR